MLLLCLQSCCLLMWWERKRVNCWWTSFVCLLYCAFTAQIEFSECCVGFQWFTQWCCPSVSNDIVCCCEKKWKRVNCWWISFKCLLLSSLHILSWVSAVFDFNDSLNDDAPESPMVLSAMWREMKRVICWWISFVCLLSFVFTTQIEFRDCCVWFQWFTQWCCSCVSNVVTCWYNWKW